MKTLSLPLALLALCSACSGQLTGGRFDARGFHHAALPLSIDYDTAQPGTLLADWKVDSHTSKYGKPGAYKDTSRSVALDYDADGKADKRTSQPSFDFTLERNSRRGTILAFTDVLDSASVGKHLSVLAREYLDRANGLHLSVARTAQGVDVKARSFTHQLHDALPIRVAGHDAYAVLADYTMDENDREPVRVALVLLPAATSLEARSNRGLHTFSAVHVFILTSDQRDFADDMNAFRTLLSRVRLAAK